MAYTKYSLTPANNTAAPPDGAPEGMLPSAVNDTMRDMMAQIRDCGDGIRDGTYTMTTPKITGGTITGAAFTGNTFTSPVISGGTINNATIGATTATTGKFTTLEATGVATFSAGAVGTPAITTTGDTNTGIFFPAADTIAFSEGGAESMRIDSSGNVGIGTTTPATKLQVVGDIASSTLKLAANTSVSGSDATIFRPADNTMAFSTGGTERMRIDSSGNIFLACTAMPSSSVGGSAFQVAESGRMQLIQSATTTSTRALQEYYNPNGNVGSISISGSLTTYNVSSDRRLKENIAPLTTGLASVLSLKPSQYNYKADPTTLIQGFIADELQSVVPHAVTGVANGIDKNGKPVYQGVDVSFLIPFLVSAIQELKAELDSVKAELQTLKGN